MYFGLNLLQEIPAIKNYIENYARPAAVELIQEVYSVRFGEINSLSSAFSIAASDVTTQTDSNCRVQPASLMDTAAL